MVDVVDVLERVLGSHDLLSGRKGDELREREGLVLVPHLLGVEPSASGDSVRTVTTVHVRHRQAFPTAIFEYQHGVGATVEESLESAFEQWQQIDLPVLEDATRLEPMYCAAIRYGHRRVILGPTAEWRAQPEAGPSGEEHDFCPCCLTTRCFDAFRPLVESDETYGVRLYAARNDRGEGLADCRVNGEDFATGQQALIAYARTWRPRGDEFRKQYVVMQRDPAV
jgi:hypothetical protein